MAKKKRRTELDIDPSILTDVDDETPPTDLDDEPVSVPEVKEEPQKAEEAPPDDEGPKVKINRAKLAMLAAGGIGALSLLGAIVWGIVAMTSGETEEPEIVKVVEVKKPVVAAPVVTVDIPPTYEFKPFLVNLGKGESVRLVRVTFDAQMSNAKVSEEIIRNLVLIRENIYTFLKSRSVEMFADEDKKKRMAVDMAIVLNRSIQTGAITKVLVSGLVIK